jgi:sepiapterin reductase
MSNKRSGHIFFITSVAARKAFRHSSVYCVSKFGQQGLVDTLRLYARKCNVRITEVIPGAVHTPMWGEVSDDFRSIMMMPEDIARPVVQAYLQPSRTTVEEIVLRPTTGDLQDE